MPSQHHLNREIERKYLLSGRPSALDAARSVEVDQGYLPGTRINERVRRMRNAEGALSYYRTIKAGAGLERLEIEEQTTQAFFEAVWPLTRGARVHKRRYYVPVDGVTWEIDEFLDRADMWLAEVELDRAEQQVTVPD